MKRRTPHWGGVKLLVVGALIGSATMAGPASAVADDTFGPTALNNGQNGTTLSADVTATARLTKTYGWTLDKSVNHPTLDLFTGDSGDATYTVTATRGQGTTAATISGQVCVTNGGAVATENLAITANVFQPANGPLLESSLVDVSARPVLGPSEVQCYGYTVPLGSNAASGTYKVTADVTITNHSGSNSNGPSPSATTTMSSIPTTVHGSLNVFDTNGKNWTFNDSASAVYTQTFTSKNKGTNRNTVTSTYDDGNPGPTDYADVTVNTYDLDVTNTVHTSLTRTYNWDIDKSADQNALTLALNQVFDVVNYTVQVKAQPADSDWAASGTITVYNPAPINATLTQVMDTMGALNATVTGPGDAPYVVPAGGSRVFSYTVDLPSAAPATSMATATLRNTPSGTTDFTGQAAVDFTKATVNEVDETATVTDTYNGSAPFTLGEVKASESPKTFSYTRSVGSYTAPGAYSVNNTATVRGDDTGTEHSDSVTIPVTVPGGGCSLTIGYWKNHAGGVGNNANMLQPLLPIRLGTASGLKSHNVTTSSDAKVLLGYSGDASNGINKLYGQLLAAKLNSKNGASGSAVATVITEADNFLATRDSKSWSGLSKAEKNQVTNWMSALDAYNNGITGPGHCTQ